GGVVGDEMLARQRRVEIAQRGAAFEGEAAGDAADGLVDRTLELPVLRHPITRRHGHLHETDAVAPLGLPLEEALEAAQPLDDSLRVVEAVDPEQDHLAAEVVPETRGALAARRLGGLGPEALVVDAD